MGKNNIRRKGKTADATIRPTDNPDAYQIPVEMYQVELFCRDCEAGVLRPTTSKLAAPTSANPQNPNAPPMVIHVCSNEECSHSENIPFPPFPRPSVLPKVDVEDPNVLGMIKGFRRQRLEFEAKQAAAKEA